MVIRTIIWAVLAAVVFVNGSYAAEDINQQMRTLAADRGCMLCHDFQPTTAAGGQVLPMAPSWREIAMRYKSDSNAEERLTNTVLNGIGTRLGERHWAGKVSTVGMFSNTREIDPHEAQALVHWILSLEK